MTLNLNQFPLQAVNGDRAPLSKHSGEVLLVVNVASQCGFTPQYKGLQDLHERFSSRGFAVLGFPCNQFGAQEPGDEAEIRDFCETNYKVTFPLFGKIDVNGDKAHPLFKELKKSAPGLLGLGVIKWNFTKFLIDRNGRVLKRFAPQTSPEDIASEIEKLL